MRRKICRYCRGEFNEIDFPAQFERMVTCGKVGCMRLRRLENVKNRKLNLRISSKSPSLF